MKSFDELKALIEQRGVHAAFGEPGEGFGIEQSPFELATFLCRMQELGVQSVLEIGTGYKGGLSRFLAHDMGWAVTSVDVQDYGHTFAGVTYLNPDNAPDDLPKHDLVFIDGNHALESVALDYELWRGYADKVLAFHDIAGLRNCDGVKVFWKRLSALTVSKEVIAPTKQSGIGWIEL